MSCQCQSAAESPCRTPEEAAKFDELGRFIASLNVDSVPDRRRGYLIQILHRAQNIFGYLPEEVQRFVAEALSLSRAEVYGVISFYSYFTDKPVGRYKINVCTGTACFVKGAPKVLDELKRRLGIKEGESTPDGRFFLGALRCVGACSLAPVVMVNDKVYGNMTADKVADILKECGE
ncbi:MAG: NAD(P)H-dependent oxidoreductase subunit E [Lentisphaeria bacterium]|nr:NAD(P)H-dependent oxidoreductase subunit E [Lentisphaeria bacterium]